MTMKHFILFFLLVFQSVYTVLYSQEIPYNLTRAAECITNKDIDTAKEYLNKELQNNPYSVTGLDLLGYIYFRDREYGKAISLFDKAIEYGRKKDKDDLSIVYYHRAGIHAVLGDTVKSISDYKESISLNPNNPQALEELADIYFYIGNYDYSNSTYKQLMKLDSGNPYPYYGIARNAYFNNDYHEARKYIHKGELLDSDKERSYIMRMRVESMAKNYSQTLEYAIKAIKENNTNSEAYSEIMNLTDIIYQTVVDRIIKQSFLEKENDIWNILLSHVYMQKSEYNKAIECLTPIINSESENKLLAIYLTAVCNDCLYKDEEVVKLMNIAIEIDSTDADFYYHRAYSSFFLQDFDLAEQDFKKAMELNKEYGYFCYYMLGWIKEMDKDYEAALSCYDMSIALNNAYAYSYMMKGFILKDYLNKQKEAEQAFLNCIELDKGIEQSTCRQYAYVGLGDFDKAIAINDSIIAKFSQDAGVYYDAACLYSRMGKQEEAILFLRKCLENGYLRIKHIESDNDLDSIKMTSEYHLLLEQFKNKKESDNKVTLTPLNSTEVLEIPLTLRRSGTYTVKCFLNEMPVSLVLDTGSTNVSISSIESDYMLKNGYISQNDFQGYENYQNATGDYHKARVLLIKKFRIGGKVIENVRASVIPNQEAPLLLGQNVLNRLGKVEIDPQKKILKIYPFHELQ